MKNWIKAFGIILVIYILPVLICFLLDQFGAPAFIVLGVFVVFFLIYTMKIRLDNEDKPRQ